MSRVVSRFLRNSFHRGGLHEVIAQLLRALAESLEATASRLCFVLGGAWVVRCQARPEGSVKADCQLARRGSDGCGCADTGGQAAVEGPQRGRRLAHVDGGDAKNVGGTGRGAAGVRPQALPPAILWPGARVRHEVPGGAGGPWVLSVPPAPLSGNAVDALQPSL
jgi:hypothetical protein